MCSPLYGFPATPVVARMCVYTAGGNSYINLKSTRTRTKNIFKMNKKWDTAAKKSRYKRSRDK